MIYAFNSVLLSLLGAEHKV